MKRVRVLHYGLGPRLGGIETYLKKITTIIDRNRFEFCFLIMGYEKPCYYDELINMGCSFYFITSRRENFIKNWLELKQLFEKEKFDVIHCHLNSLSYILPIVVAHNYGCKVIVHSRNAGLKAGVTVRTRHKMNYYRLPKKDIECVAVSELAGKWMFGSHINFTVLNNGVDINKYCYSENARQRIRKELDISDKEVIIHVGAFKPQKNHVLLIKIFNEYSRRHPDAVLMLVGDGDQRRKIEELVNDYALSDKVLFMGITEKIPQLLSAADKFLFPSLYEGFPNALIEAQCAGLLCVISDTITRQVCLDNMCRTVSLDAPIKEWVTELEKKYEIDRSKSANIIKKNKLDTESEIKLLSAIYKKIMDS